MISSSVRHSVPRTLIRSRPLTNLMTPKSRSRQYALAAAITGLSGAALIYNSQKTEILDPTKAIKRGNSIELIDENADLSKYPAASEYPFDKNCQLTIGDLHGNALKLLYFLLRQNVIVSNQKDYLKFAEIYHKNTDDLTKTDIDEFKAILERVQWKKAPTGAMVRLIGDELCDRGSNDYFTLKILEKLYDNHIPFEIIVSNHGFEFIHVYEKGLINNESYMEKGGFGGSLTNLRKLVKKELVTMDEIDSLLKKAYQPSLKIVSYTHQTHPVLFQKAIRLSSSIFNAIFCDDIAKPIDDWMPKEKITIYTHAPVGLKTVKTLAEHDRFGIKYCDDSVEDLMTTIDKINEKFNLFVQKNEVSVTFSPDVKVGRDITGDVTNISFEYPMKRCLWSRGHQDKDLPVRKQGLFEVYYAHGHDGAGKIDARFMDYITNLDNQLGKGPENAKKKYSILYTHEKCSTKKLTLSDSIDYYVLID